MVMERAIRKREIMLIVLALAAALIIISWISFFQETGKPEATVTFNAPEGDASFKCEIADTSSERATGLMDREELGSDEGMLFVFESTQNVTFWMKNTLIPLDIVFIDESGLVVNIEEANPQPGASDADLIRYSSDRPIKWVLEINQGLCETNGIASGTRVVMDFS